VSSTTRRSCSGGTAAAVAAVGVREMDGQTKKDKRKEKQKEKKTN